MSVCRFVCPLAYFRNCTPNFTKFPVRVTSSSGSIHRRQGNLLCTSGFVDDVMFLHIRPYDAWAAAGGHDNLDSRVNGFLSHGVVS